MNNDDSISTSWQTPLIIAIAIIFVVIAAIILTQIDSIQRRSLLPPKRLTIVDQEATIIAMEPNNIYFPGDEVVTATPSPTPELVSTENVPTPQSTQPPMVKPSCEVDHEDWAPYIVQREDSLTSLAFKFGVSKTSIVQMNCLTFEKVIFGQIIYLPQHEIGQSDELQCGVPQNWIHYVVHPGDTLLQLAEKYNSTVYTIMNANCMESTNLSTGRKLFLPPLKPTQAPPTKSIPSPTRSRPRVTATTTPSRQFFPTSIPSTTPLPTATATQTPTEIIGTATAIPAETPLPTATNTATISPSSTPSPTPTSLPPTATFTATPQLSNPTNTPNSPSPTVTNTPALATSTATVSVHPPAQPSSTPTGVPYP